MARAPTDSNSSLPQGFDALREQQRASAHARARQRRLGARVPAADYDYVEPILIKHEY